MSLERNATPMAAEPGPPGSLAETVTPGAISPAIRIQILSTEHWSLLASRSLAWNEVFGRTGMFLSALSGAIVALALVGQGAGFGQSFAQFAIVILPVVLFLGETTFVRLAASNYHDRQCVIGMNRIRGAYLEIAPELGRYFVMSPHDDARGVGVTMAFPPHHIPLVHILAATPTVVIVVNAAIVGALLGLVFTQLGYGDGPALIASVVGFVVTFFVHGMWGRSAIARAQTQMTPLFPSATVED